MISIDMDTSELKQRIRIRDMESRDCTDASGLLKLCFSDPWSEESLKEACRQGDYLQLCAWLPAEKAGKKAAGKKAMKRAAEDGRAREAARAGEDRRMVGYAGLKMVLDEGDITNVCIHPDWRGRGLASSLMEALLDLADRKGIVRIFLEVRSSNRPAIALYKRAGFEEVGVRKAYYENPREDALIMCRNLTEL